MKHGSAKELRQQGTEAARVDWNLAQEALKGGDLELTWRYMERVLGRLSEHRLDAQNQSLFIQTSLEFSDLCLVLGQGLKELRTILVKAKAVSEDLGDRRSQALINLHLGRLLYFRNRSSEAMAAFTEGITEVENLGDEDIRLEAAEFIGMYYFIQGKFSEARHHFEETIRSFEPEQLGRLGNPWTPVWLVVCSYYLAQFHDAIGMADYYHRLALGRSDQSLACLLESLIGVILMVLQEDEEATSHFSNALKKARQTKNVLASCFAKAGIGIQCSRQGRLNEARDWLAQAMAESRASGLIMEGTSDLMLETFFDLARKGFEFAPQFDVHKELKRAMRQSNFHLRGVVLRLSAIEAADKGDDPETIESLLGSSEEYLLQSGNPVQLAKTRIEMARLNLGQGDQERARLLAQKAWKGFSGYGEVFYPDDLRNLLMADKGILLERDVRTDLLEMFMNMVNELEPSSDLNGLLARTVVATTRFFGAERGGIFWHSTRGGANRPALRAAHNLSPDDVSAKEFGWSLSLISKAFRQNKPLVVQNEGMSLSPTKVRAVLCVPFEVEGRVQGVLYQDNSHVREGFENFESSDLVRIAKSLAGYVERLVGLSRRMEQKTARNQTGWWHANAQEIVTQDRRMLQILEEVDRVAASDSTVLIIGETGVGKELVAQRLHKMSARHDGPFVVVDPTTIPESLVESELFGHEKGAFTGADRQRPGRLELADGGTLFIDEVGEIPKSVQAKLLRALQEKTIVRVGGTITLHSDFRLVAATNRDLAAEVAVGRFREDLYYRINVIPFTIPPVRERKEDILVLAKHFLGKYASKYNRPEITPAQEDEARLLEYGWPGNVREIENMMERAVLLSTEGTLEFHLPTAAINLPGDPFSSIPTLDEIQRRHIRYVLERTGGKVGGPGGAADILGIKRSTLQDRMKKLGLR